MPGNQFRAMGMVGEIFMGLVGGYRGFLEEKLQIYGQGGNDLS